MKTWATREVLRATDLNANFDECLTTATSKTVTATHEWNAIQHFNQGWNSSAASTVSSASATALTVGANGATNPALQVDASTASSATGIKVKSAAAAAGVAISVISSGTNESLTIDAKGSGTVTIGSVSTGAIVLSRATTISAALTYGSVTLNNAVTGTGNMVLSASPTLTGTLTAAISNWSGLATFNGGATVASGQTFTVTGATITGLTAASVGAGTFPSGAFVFAGAVSGITTLATSSTINGQTISSAANFNGTLNVAAATTMNPASANGEAMRLTNGGLGRYFDDGSTERGRVFARSGGSAGLVVGVSGLGPVYIEGSALTIASGVTVTTGTTAVQALTATTGDFSGLLKRTSASQASIQMNYTGAGAINASLSTFNDTAAWYDETNARYIWQYTASTNTVSRPTGTTAVQALTAAGLITSTVGNNAQVLNAASATTGYSYGQIANTGGLLTFGVESSTGGALITGSSAYDTVLTFGSGKGLCIGVTSGAIAMRVSASSIVATAGVITAGGTNTDLSLSAIGAGGQVLLKTTFGTVVTVGNTGLTTFAAGISATAGTFTGQILTTVTTEQMRLRYDASHYLSTTVDSFGNTTFNIVGAGGITYGFNCNGSTALTFNETTLTFFAPLVTVASTTSSAGFRLTAGVAPTSPINGEMWQDGTNLKIRIGGVTKTVTLT
jgi:hypothetical protein